MIHSRNCSSVTPVFHHAPSFSSRIAITDDSGNHSYSSLHRRAEHVASRLDVPLGSRVALLTPNNSQYVVGKWAIWMGGCVAVPLCQAHPAATLKYYIEDSGAEAVVVTEDLAGKIKEVVEELGIRMIHLEKVEEEGESGEVRKDVTFLESSPAMFLYTSGTTGPPKGVVLTHGNLISQAQCLISSWEWTMDDTILHVLPLHHTHGIVNCIMCPLTVGAKVIMLPSFNPAKVWSHLVASPPSINVFMAVPTIYAKLLEHLKKTPHDAEHTVEACSQGIRLMVSGSAALPTPVLEAWRLVTGHTLLERYGMTEIGMALSNPLHGERHPGCVGRPLPSVKAKIVRWGDDGSCAVLAEASSEELEVTPGMEGEQGELLIKGPNVFKEYHNKPEATAKEFTEDGWFKTGDTSRVEATSGVFKILGRTSVDIIKSGGYKISALDVERVLLTHPDIDDVAVVGVEDPVWGQVVSAVVVARGAEISLDVVREWGKEKMAGYSLPNKMVVVEELPRNVMGKVNKKELVKQVFG